MEQPQLMGGVDGVPRVQDFLLVELLSTWLFLWMINPLSLCMLMLVSPISASHSSGKHSVTTSDENHSVPRGFHHRSLYRTSRERFTVFSGKEVQSTVWHDAACGGSCTSGRPNLFGSFKG